MRLRKKMRARVRVRRRKKKQKKRRKLWEDLPEEELDELPEFVEELDKDVINEVASLDLAADPEENYQSSCWLWWILVKEKQVQIKRSMSSSFKDFILRVFVFFQMHAVVLLYNYYHRKQFPGLEFLDYESFCKVTVKAKPSMIAIFQDMKNCNGDGQHENLSIVEKAIMKACKISLELDISKAAPTMERWPTTKVAVFLMDSRQENCSLYFGDFTEGVWSLIEKADAETGDNSVRAKRRPTGRILISDENRLRHLAFSAVKEKTGIDQANLVFLENHVTYSLSEEKTTARLFIMKCESVNEDLFEVPIRDAIESLQGPLVKKNSYGCEENDVVMYFHLLPYAEKIADWFSSALKLLWLLENVDAVKDAIKKGDSLFGTIDTWLIWNLTGGCSTESPGLHVTDVSNASRTMLMNIKTFEWDQSVLETLGISHDILPKIVSNAEVIGNVGKGWPITGIPIAGCLGDQHAAMLGQACRKGEAKSTYGTGAFILLNTGEELIKSTHGLLTTVAYKLGPNATTNYALEGSIAIAGAAVQWLRDSLGIIKSASEIEELANKVENSGGVYFVPASNGLFAPWWRDDARGICIGMTRFTNRSHIARAVLESMCFQVKDVLDSMHKDAGDNAKSKDKKG